MPLKHFLTLFILLVGALPGARSQAEELNVYFKTTPRLELLRPFANTVDLSLLVTEADGRPVKQGSVDVRLDAPPPGKFFSTDYPLVEGALLSEMRLRLRQGKAGWKYLFPIRGQYRLAVDVATDDGRKARQVFSFRVRENQMKWLALGAFSVALFGLGLVAGRIFTGAMALAAALITAGVVAAPAGISAAQQGEAAFLEVEPATVGIPARVRWRLADGAQNRQILLTITISHLEKDKIVFAIEKVPVVDEWSMKFHFPDGADYRITAVADVSGSASARREQIVSVTGVEPPAKPTAAAISYFVALIALGLGVGRWSKRG